MVKNKNLVWYVCYGSNLCFERFMCYLTGNECAKYNLKARSKNCFDDQTPPRDKRLITIPFELYFAYKSSNWNNCGVAFLDTHSESKTFGRAYLITKEQFEHVCECEGSSIYDDVHQLDDIDGIPAYTVTCSFRREPFEEPNDDYKRVLIDGLKECGISQEDAELYVLNSIQRRLK